MTARGLILVGMIPIVERSCVTHANILESLSFFPFPVESVDHNDDRSVAITFSFAWFAYPGKPVSSLLHYSLIQCVVCENRTSLRNRGKFA